MYEKLSLFTMKTLLLKSQCFAWCILIFGNFWVFFTRLLPTLNANLANLHDIFCNEDFGKIEQVSEVHRTFGEVDRLTLNVTAKHGRLLVYNSLPVSGSPRLKKLIRDMGAKHKFHVEEPPIFPPYFQPELPEDALPQIRLKNTEFVNSTWAYVREMHFYNFDDVTTRSESVYITMIRDPVDRLVSDFYRKRHGAWPVAHFMEKLRNKFSQWKEKDWNSCVMQNDPECPTQKGELNDFLNVPFLCGHHPNCSIIGSEWALERAKRNVLQSYAVVGVAELWEHTLIALQYYVPRFFADAYKHYTETHRTSDMVFSEWYFYKNASQQVRHYVRKQLPLEMELYDFVRQKLWDKYEAIFLEFVGTKTK